MNEILSRLTPVDDSYATCKFTEATLAIYGIDPEVVTKELGITPSRTQTVGLPRVMPSGKARIGTVNSWLLFSQNQVPSKDLRRHLDWLLDTIEPASAQVLDLQQRPGLKMAVRCYWESAHGDGGPTLWPEQMRRMAKLNLECTFSCAYYGDDEEKGMMPEESE